MLELSNTESSSWAAGRHGKNTNIQLKRQAYSHIQTQLSETPASAQAPIPKSEPKPSPGNQAEEEKTISTTVAKAAVTTPAVPAPLSVVPTTDMLQTEMTAVVAPIPAAEIQKAVITAAEVTLKETDKDKVPDETQVETEPMSLLPAVPTEADVVKV